MTREFTPGVHELRVPPEDRAYASDREGEASWLWLLLFVLLGAASFAGYYFYQQQRDQAGQTVPGPIKLPAESPAGIATDKPEIRHPIPTAEIEAQKPLPALDQSDAAMRRLATDLVGGTAFQSLVNPQQLVRRMVATVDNLPRKTAPVQVRPLKPVPGQYTPNAANTRRYARYVQALESLDTHALVQGYVALYPLFQRAYEELGFPGHYFNDRLVEAIDDLLAAPDLAGPVELIQPKVFYQYADPGLEGRSAGQKVMIRMGRENAAKVKAKLREIRREITKPVTRG